MVEVKVPITSLVEALRLESSKTILKVMDDLLDAVTDYKARDEWFSRANWYYR